MWILNDSIRCCYGKIQKGSTGAREKHETTEVTKAYEGTRRHKVMRRHIGNCCWFLDNHASPSSSQNKKPIQSSKSVIPFVSLWLNGRCLWQIRPTPEDPANQPLKKIVFSLQSTYFSCQFLPYPFLPVLPFARSPRRPLVLQAPDTSRTRRAERSSADSRSRFSART